MTLPQLAEGAAKPPLVAIGGYAALMSAVRAPKLFRCAIGYAGKGVTWKLYDDSAHGVYSLEGRREMYQALLNFLNAHIGLPEQWAEGS